MAGALPFGRRVFDVVISGGGPAGLSAALVLGRCRRQVLLCDVEQPRNARSVALHGYLTRDGTPPLELLRLGRAELQAYGIEPCHSRVIDLACVGGPFEATLDSGQDIQARTALMQPAFGITYPTSPASMNATASRCTTVRTATDGRNGTRRLRSLDAGPAAQGWHSRSRHGHPTSCSAPTDRRGYEPPTTGSSRTKASPSLGLLISTGHGGTEAKSNNSSVSSCLRG